MSKKLLLTLGLILTLAVSAAVRASFPPGHASPSPTLLVTGLEGATGSAIGPDGFLYVTEGATGTLTRVHPHSGHTATVATGLPPSIVGIGGAIDVAFVGRTPYVLVTLVGPDVGGNSQVGIYRIDGRQSFTVIADIGAYALAHPPGTPFDVPTGVQYSLQAYAGGFLVTDGHHNRVLFVTLDGHISEFAVFDNIAPTGLAVTGPLVLMTQAGAVPHLPQEGQGARAEPNTADRAGDRIGRAAAGRCRIRLRWCRLCAGAGRLPAGQSARVAGTARYWVARGGQRRREPPGGGHQPEPADIARDSRRHRLHRLAGGRDLDHSPA